MIELLAIAVGGALGALGRHAFTVLGEDMFSVDASYYSILVVNILGSLLIGILFVFLVERNLLGNAWRPLLMGGFLGAFTTFSTFSLQVVALLETGRYLSAGGYMLASVIICVAATGAGIALARLFP